MGGTFLEPGKGALAYGEEARLDPFAAIADILIMELGPDLVLGLSRHGILAHAPHAGLSHLDRPAHHFELIGRFDRPRSFGEFLALDKGDAALAQEIDAERLHLVDGDSHGLTMCLSDPDVAADEGREGNTLGCGERRVPRGPVSHGLHDLAVGPLVLMGETLADELIASVRVSAF